MNPGGAKSVGEGPCSMLDAALEYAARRWPVIPLVSDGKAPLATLVPRGVAQATCDPEVITRWFTRARTANVGVACHRLLAVDVDPRNGGDRRIEALLAEHGPFPLTLMQQTGGGVHYLFEQPSVPLRGKLVDGIDLVHGPRRYIVAAPSVHRSGQAYAWLTPLSVPLAVAPDWLVSLGLRGNACPVRTDVRQDLIPSRLVARATAYARKIPPAISGRGGHAQTFLTACRLVRGFSLTPDETYTVMCEWNRACEPPWSERDLRRKIEQAMQHGRIPFGAMLKGQRP